MATHINPWKHGKRANNPMDEAEEEVEIIKLQLCANNSKSGDSEKVNYMTIKSRYRDPVPSHWHFREQVRGIVYITDIISHSSLLFCHLSVSVSVSVSESESDINVHLNVASGSSLNRFLLLLLFQFLLTDSWWHVPYKIIIIRPFLCLNLSQANEDSQTNLLWCDYELISLLKLLGTKCHSKVKM